MSQMIPITATGFEKLKEELRRLKAIERPGVISEIAEARALGDLSENAEYHAAREKQGFIEGRIQELEDKLGRVQVIVTGTGSIEKVVFGATVTLKDVSEDSKGEKKTYRIVGDLEADLKSGAISLSSPLAASLVNKAMGEIVTVTLPKGEREYEIITIGWETPQGSSAGAQHSASMNIS
jgi:transcription elongation factor GreA